MPPEPTSHFDHLATSWTLLQQAHDGDAPSEQRADARGQLLGRYEPVIRRYLGGALRNEADREEAVNECFQRFCVKVMDGSLQGASPERGRFRPYLRACLSNLVTDYQRERRRQMPGLPAAEPVAQGPPVSDEEFTAMCREELVARALQGLAREEQQAGGVLYTVLKLKMDRPELRSGQMAEHLTNQFGRAVNAGWVRKRLLEARQRLRELLRQEVGRELLRPTDEEVDEELAELGLLEHCRPGEPGA